MVEQLKRSTEATRKQRLLIDALLEKTRKRKLEWKVKNEVPNVLVAGRLIQMLEAKNENHEELYIVQIFNSEGIVTETFDDEQIADFATSETRVVWFKKMQVLYDMACRQASGADVAIDEILSALDTDDDAPF